VKRREFIAGLGGAAAWPLAGRAQQPAMPVIGLLSGGAPDSSLPLPAFRQGLNEAGYVEGRNVAIEYRWAEGHYDRLSALTADLLDRKVAAIVAFGNVAARAAKAATTTIPVVFSSGSDPVGIGLVKNLNRPGTNMTGVSILNNELESKRLELLVEVVPHAATIAFLVNPNSPTTSLKLRSIQTAAHELNRQVFVLNASNDREFETIFGTIAEQRIEAMMIASDNIFANEGSKLGLVSATHNVPVISAYRAFVSAGGLMSYGTSEADAYHQVSAYAGRILRGEKPADLPVLQAVKVELVLNLKTAKALGITFPLPLVGRADEVIE
jgi:putative tryptophan/tyrosine transport system substrate-binding protein